MQVSKTLNALYAVRAYESSGCHATFDIDVSDLAHGDTLKYLEAKGVVECVARSESVSSWRITGFGEGAIETCSQVAPSEKACAIRSDVSLKQMTTLELLTVLESKRWKARVWRQEGGDLRPPAVRVAGGDCGPKVWWVKPTHKTIIKAYLKCLVKTESMPDCEIEHFGSWERIPFLKRNDFAARHFKSLHSECSSLRSWSGSGSTFRSRRAAWPHRRTQRKPRGNPSG